MPFAPAGTGSGPAPLWIIAGPCSVESADQYGACAEAARRAGAQWLRGGAFKPRTSPYAFQGMGRRGLEIMRAAADDVGLGLVTETLAPADTALVAEFADVLQIGARNMSNVALLAAVSDTGMPVLLKRGMTATVDELLVAAETLLERGAPSVAICERGSRTSEPGLRHSLDIAGVVELKLRSQLPVIVDPSHGTGRPELVAPMSKAAVAAGADGLMLEIHPDPATALSDGFQALDLSAFAELIASLEPMRDAADRVR